MRMAEGIHFEVCLLIVVLLIGVLGVVGSDAQGVSETLDRHRRATRIV